MLRPALLLGLLLLASSPGAPAEEQRVRGKVPLGGVETLRLEMPVGTIQVVPSSGEEARFDLTLDCLGEMIACADAARQMRFGVQRQGPKATVTLTGPGGFEKRLRNPKPEPDGPPQIEGSYDESGRTWGRSYDWRWRKPGRGDWAGVVFLKVRLPMTAALELELGEGDLEIHQPRIPVKAEIGTGTFGSEVSHHHIGAVRLEVRKGHAAILDVHGRPPEGVRQERGSLEWSAPPDSEASGGEGEPAPEIEVQIDRGSAWVRVL